jgi:hypothetical protein
MSQEGRAMHRQIKTRKMAERIKKHNSDCTRKEVRNIIQGQTGA